MILPSAWPVYTISAGPVAPFIARMFDVCLEVEAEFGDGVFIGQGEAIERVEQPPFGRFEPNPLFAVALDREVGNGFGGPAGRCRAGSKGQRGSAPSTARSRPLSGARCSDCKHFLPRSYDISAAVVGSRRGRSGTEWPPSAAGQGSRW